MAKAHPSRDLVAAYAQGSLPIGLEEQLRKHLAGCERCRGLVPARLSHRELPFGEGSDFPPLSRPSSSDAAQEAYRGILERVFDSVLTESAAIDQQRSLAPDLVKELGRMDHAQALLLIKNSPRYHVWALAEALLEESRRGWMEDAWLSESLAELALEVALRIDATGLRAKLLSDLKAEAWSYIGNCLRIQSDLSSAEVAFRKAEEFLERGTRDLLEYARYSDLRASLFAEKREYKRANHALQHAVDIYQKLGERHLEGKALVKHAKFLYDSGAVEESIAVTERASQLISAGSDPALFYYLKKNLVWYLAEVGRLDDAMELMPEVRKLAREHGGRLERLRFLWTEGMLRRRLGQLALAEEALKQVREGFIAANIGYDVAQVSLDLAALYLETGRTNEVRRLAVETMPLFASRNVQRELIVAWSLFTRAAEREAATLQLLDDVSGQIRRLQRLKSDSDTLQE